MKFWYAMRVSDDSECSRNATLTLQEDLVLGELARVVELPEVLGLLGDILPLGERVSLVCDDVGRDRVELRDERRQVDVWRIVSRRRACSPARPYFSTPQSPSGICCLRPSLRRPGLLCPAPRPAGFSLPCPLRPPLMQQVDVYAQ
jgi:hypothetical protein